MTTDEKLALFVKAQVAAIRAEQARERSALLERKAAPVTKAIDQYENLYGEDADPSEHFDMLMRLIIQNGGGDLSREDLIEGMRMYEQRGAAELEAARAMHALNDAMGAFSGTTLEWVGADRATVERAVQEALKAS